MCIITCNISTDTTLSPVGWAASFHDVELNEWRHFSFSSYILTFRLCLVCPHVRCKWGFIFHTSHKMKQQEDRMTERDGLFGTKWVWQRPKYIGKSTVFLVPLCWLNDCLWRIYRRCFNIWSYVALSNILRPKIGYAMSRSEFRWRKLCYISGYYSHIFLILFNNNISTAYVWSNICMIVNNEEGGWSWWLSIWWSAAAGLLVSWFLTPLRAWLFFPRICCVLCR